METIGVANPRRSAVGITFRLNRNESSKSTINFRLVILPSRRTLGASRGGHTHLEERVSILARRSEMTRTSSSDTGLPYAWWSLAWYLLNSFYFFVGGTFSFAATVLAAVAVVALAALRFFVDVGAFCLAVVTLAIVVVELAACFLASHVTRAGVSAFSLVVLAAVVLVMMLAQLNEY